MHMYGKGHTCDAQKGTHMQMMHGKGHTCDAQKGTHIQMMHGKGHGPYICNSKRMHHVWCESRSMRANIIDLERMRVKVLRWRSFTVLGTKVAPFP